MEQMQYNLLFRWFVGLGIDDAVWVPTVFSKNRDRLLNTDIARKFLAAILVHENVAPLLSEEHFSVDGTLIEAWASMKSFQPKDGTDGSEPPAAGPSGEGQTPVETQSCKPAAPAEAPAAADNQAGSPNQQKAYNAGTVNDGSFVVDYQFNKHFDVYAGVNYSAIDGGLASGYLANNNTSVVTGARLKF